MANSHLTGGARAAGIALAALLAALLAASLALPALAQDADSLGDQLRDLAAEQRIDLSGVELLDAAPPSRAAGSGTLFRRLEALLSGYNFILMHHSDGRIAGVRILGRATKGPPKVTEATVTARRKGAHYLVDAVLVGPTGLWSNRRMVVDTGASTVVLPVSAIRSLGLRETDLTLGKASTAGGEVTAQLGTLAAVRVGHAEVKDVEVTFIADEQLGRTALLGMSFLSHFQVTIDDAGQRIILTAK